MQYVINRDYGGFTVPQEVADEIGCDVWSCFGSIRTDPVLIEWVNDHSRTTTLRVVEIPDEATDWELLEYDGLEQVLAVVDGHIVHICY